MNRRFLQIEILPQINVCQCFRPIFTNLNLRCVSWFLDGVVTRTSLEELIPHLHLILNKFIQYTSSTPTRIITIITKLSHEFSMDDWIKAKVITLGLDVDVYVDYAKSILEDEDMEIEERVESVVSILTGAADGQVEDEVIANTLNAIEMVNSLQHYLKDAKANEEEKFALQQAEEAMKEIKLREQEKERAKIAAEKEKEKALAHQNLSREELARREQLINDYGFSVLTEFDEDGNVTKVVDKEKNAAKLDSVGQNINKLRVQQAQRDLREKQKLEHEKKVAREKELLEKDKLRKDKAKKRTMKREKQRGCG